MKRKLEAISEEDVRRKVDKKFKNRAALTQHLVSYAIVNLLLWSLYISARGGFPWPLFVTAGWGIGMLSHWADYYFKYGKGARKREAEVEAEVLRQVSLSRMIEEERRRRLYDEEATGDADVYDLDNVELRHVRLTDDGELTDFDMLDDREELEQRKNR